MSNKLSFIFKIAGMQIIILALVTITGLFAYEKFSGVIEGISEKLTPSSRLVKTGELLNHLHEAEINAKSYSLTRDTLYLDQFYFAVENVETDLAQILAIEKQDSIDSKTTDSLGVIIKQKFDVLHELVSLKDKFRVEQSLDRVNKKIAEEKKVAWAIDSSNTGNITNITNVTHVTNVQKTHVIEEKEQQRRGWLFNKNKTPSSKGDDENDRDDDEEMIVVEDTIVIQEEPIVSNVSVTTVESVETPAKPDSVIQQSFTNITREIKLVKYGESQIEKEIKEKELSLILADEVLNIEITKLLEDIHEEELAQVGKEAKLAEATIHDTKTQIAWFCLFIGLMLLFMAVVIIKYVRANAKYRNALRMAKRNAEDLAKAKQHFLANISHEIRTPINAIAGFTEQLSTSNLSQEQKEQIKIIHKSTEHLSYLLNDLLDFSKLEADKITFEKIVFHPSELVSDVLDVAANMAGKKEITLKAFIDPQIPETLVGDPYRLKQILLNLYSNSIKFTESGSINLEAKVILQSEKEVRLLIVLEDTGIGMNDDQVSNIFTEFAQANESITRKFGGTGLGLSIVRMLIDKMGGQIFIESEEGVGTKTTIEIPYMTYQTQPEMAQPQPEKHGSLDEIHQSLSNLRVLIVDDEEYNRKLLAAILKKYNTIYTEAADGMEALQELDRNDYDFILMDARMPNMNGVETTREIRAMRDPKKASIPILGISASTSDEDRAGYLEAGMNTSIPKPFKEALLLSEIHRILKERKPASAHVENGKENGHKMKSTIRFNDLQEMCDGDKNFYADMLRTFIEGTNDGIRRIREAYAREDYEALGGQAHKIAAPCNHIGAIHLYGLLKKMEEIVYYKQDPNQLAELVVKVQDEAIGVIDITQKELDSVMATT